MIPTEVKREMQDIAMRIRAILPGYRGSVEFHMAADPGKPVTVDMNIRLCDVTRMQKQS